MPIALSPSIQDVGPTINLVYASGQMGGIAGQGWNISAISNISRIATRLDIDGFVDGVDFDDNDKLALDGQRLLIKTGTYWTDKSTYETEVQSNTVVKLVVVSGIITFEVTAPDGSRSFYGGASSNDLTAYYINRFEDTKGNFIVYSYNKPLDKSLCINEISFSANTNSNTTPLNKIKFNYVTAARTENAYVAGVKIEKVEILNNIQVFTNGLQFKKYQLTHSADDLGYQRVTKLQEFNGVDSVGANPVDFEYYNSSYNESRVAVQQDDATLNNMASPKFSGDFTGEGDVDFIKGNMIYKNQLGAAPSSETLPFTADANTFAVNTNIKSLTNSILKVETSGNSILLKNYDLSGSSTILNNEVI